MSMAPSSVSTRARAYMKTPEFTKLWRYCTVSGISTVTSLVLLYVFYRVVGLSPRWANVVAACIATVPSYYLNRSWAWGKNGRSHFMKEVAPFWLIALVSLLISTEVVGFAGHESADIASKDVRALILVAANFVTYGFLWVGKFMLFNKLLFKHREPAAVS
ncbi:MAG TPA: GtrA family protein [Acidimicrobiales bacterium]